MTTATETEGSGTFEAEKVLVAVGRRPVVETIRPENAGLELTERSFLETDARCRTNRPHIFAVGDVAGEPMLAHKASAEGQTAAEVIAGKPTSMADRPVPTVVFTDPEIATVGQSAAERDENDVLVGEFPFYASGRALTTNHSGGFVRIVAAADGTILGAHVVGPEASELIAELGLAVSAELTLETLGESIHAHPTLIESSMEAAENALDRAIHTLNR